MAFRLSYSALPVKFFNSVSHPPGFHSRSVLYLWQTMAYAPAHGRCCVIMGCAGCDSHSFVCSSVPDGLSSVTEGKATILHDGNDVFYNKAQVVNRDISIAVLRWFSAQQSVQPAKRSKKAGAIGMGKLPSGTPFKVHVVSQALNTGFVAHLACVFTVVFRLLNYL